MKDPKFYLVEIVEIIAKINNEGSIGNRGMIMLIACNRSVLAATSYRLVCTNIEAVVVVAGELLDTREAPVF